ncbi:MAG: LysR family transcriptional regulator [Paracoccaceae bacterium]
MNEIQNQAILHELLRSFTTLAETLNLSRAVEKLQTTRQTVRRHIRILEEARKAPLFIVQDRQYHLTEAGRQALPEALELLYRGENWLANRSHNINGLLHIRTAPGDAIIYHLQQHPVSRIWQQGPGILHDTLQAWAAASGELEHPAMQRLRPYFMVYRWADPDWILTEIGDDSSFSSWFGWVHSRSSIGRPLDRLPGGGSFASLLAKPLEDIHANHGLRLDHIHTRIPRGDGQEPTPISFERLTLGCRYPDGSFAMVNLVWRTYDLEIPDLPEAMIRSMPDELIMNFDAAELKTGQSAQV